MNVWRIAEDCRSLDEDGDGIDCVQAGIYDEVGLSLIANQVVAVTESSAALTILTPRERRPTVAVSERVRIRYIQIAGPFLILTYGGTSLTSIVVDACVWRWSEDCWHPVVTKTQLKELHDLLYERTALFRLAGRISIEPYDPR